MKTTTKLIEQINEVYNKGYDMTMTAEMLGCTKTTVQNYVREPRPRNTKFELLEVRENGKEKDKSSV